MSLPNLKATIMDDLDQQNFDDSRLSSAQIEKSDEIELNS